MLRASTSRPNAPNAHLRATGLGRTCEPRGLLSPAHPLLYLPLSPVHRRAAKTAPGANGAPQEAGARISESQRYPHPAPPHPTPLHGQNLLPSEPGSGTPVPAAALCPADTGSPPLPGFPTRPKTGGGGEVGVEDGEGGMGPREGGCA